MNKKTRVVVNAGVLGAMYIALSFAQNLIWPTSTTFAIQFRLAEVLNIFAFYTPAAVPGLSIGCLCYNLLYAESLPLDFLAGTLATALATLCMYRLRRLRWKHIPWLGLCMPAVFNGPLVGWELTAFLAPEGFTLPVFGVNVLLVAVGETAVMLTCGLVLYRTMERSRLAERLFGAAASGRGQKRC